MPKLFKRRWLWGPLLLAGVVGTAYLLIRVNETGVSKANFDRIQNGWTEQQVEELLGGRASKRIDDVGHLHTSFWWGGDEDEPDMMLVAFGPHLSGRLCRTPTVAGASSVESHLGGSSQGENENR